MPQAEIQHRTPSLRLVRPAARGGASAPAPRRRPARDCLEITHVCVPGAHGGLEAVVAQLAAGQARAGHRVSIVAVIPGFGAEPPLLGLARAAGVVVREVRIGVRDYRIERTAIRAALGDLAPDVVHTHGYRADVLHAPVARALGIPIVTTLHGFTGGGWKNRAYEWLQRRAAARMDGVVAVSRPIADRMRAAGARLRCIPNAFSPRQPALAREVGRERLGVSGDRLLLGWVGRLSAEKGGAVLVDALTHLADLPVTAVVVGDGPERAALQARAAERRVERLVHWMGPIADAAALFPAFDVFTLSSHTEGTPIVLFEAMAAEVPIVATRVGGVPDVVGPDEAVLVAPGDAEAFAAAIRAVVADPDGARRRAGRAAARLRRQFAAEPWLARYESLYREIIATRGPSAC